jgi:phenylacetic acid degradation operon negative regulatory protein
MQRARFAEQREGVWLRPSNLYQEDFEGSEAGSRCYWYSAYPTRSDTELAGALWDLEEWTATANSLRAQIRPIARRLREEDLSALPEGFEASAAVLRHLLADPLLPEELLDRSWPGTALRREYAKFDELYRLLLGSWFRMGR